MRIALFCHSLASDWNNGNAHFLRGLVVALQEAGHEVLPFEPRANWSTTNLVETAGAAPLLAFADTYPTIRPQFYEPPAENRVSAWQRLLGRLLKGVDALVVHEWNPPKLVRAAGRLAVQGDGPRAFFHDTHYRAVTAPRLWRRLELQHYTAVLAFSPALPPIYRQNYGLERVHVLHEGADTRIFRPLPPPPGGPLYDVVFIGNWGDDDRAASMHSYVFDVAAALPRRRFLLHGVRYGPDELATLARSGIRYGGWVANLATPAVYAAARLAVHIPRQPYLDLLPGTPTIRVFEVLACGRALISLPWEDTDQLFSVDSDYEQVRSPDEMIATIERLCDDDEARGALGRHGLQTVRERHTCAHRAAQLVPLLQGEGTAR